MIVGVDEYGIKHMMFQRKSYRKARWKKKAERMSDRTMRCLPCPFTLIVKWT